MGDGVAMSPPPPPSPRSGEPIDPPPIDPLLRDRPRTPPRGADPQRTRRPSGHRRPHPARGARTVALAASVASTAALAAWIAAGEGAFGDAGDDDTSTSIAAVATTAPAVPVADDTSTTAAEEVAEGTTAATEVPDPTEETTTTVATETSTTTTTVAEPVAEDVAATSTAVAFADGVFVGSAEYTEWGDVQVEVTIADGQIVDVATVQVPSGRRSTPINDGAVPVLEADAISTQSADLDVVSGATYTSVTYADSLQAALDQAALAASTDGVASA